MKKDRYGYQLIYWPMHHLAMKNGWVPVHRLVAEEKIGRRLKKGEVVHHINGLPDDNRPENLDVLPSAHHHKHAHSKSKDKRRKPGEKNSLIECACGCGIKRHLFNQQGVKRRYVLGHNIRGKRRCGPRGKLVNLEAHSAPQADTARSQ